MDNFSVIMFVSEKNDIAGNNFKKFLDLLQSLLNVYGEEVACSETKYNFSCFFITSFDTPLSPSFTSDSKGYVWFVYI